METVTILSITSTAPPQMLDTSAPLAVSGAMMKRIKAGGARARLQGQVTGRPEAVAVGRTRCGDLSWGQSHR